MDESERKQIYAEVLRTLRWKCGQRREITVDKLCDTYFSNRSPEVIRECVTEMVENNCVGIERSIPVSWVGVGAEVIELTDDERSEELVDQITRDIFHY